MQVVVQLYFDEIECLKSNIHTSHCCAIHSSFPGIWRSENRIQPRFQDILAKVEDRPRLHVEENVPDQVRTLSQVGTSSHMAYGGGGGGGGLTQGVPIWLKKFLLGPIVKLNSLCSFQVSSLLIHLGTCIRVRIRFKYQRFAGGFYYVFKM